MKLGAWLIVCVLVKVGNPNGIGISLDTLRKKPSPVFRQSKGVKVDGNLLKTFIDRSSQSIVRQANPDVSFGFCNPFFEKASPTFLKWATQAEQISAAVPSIERSFGTSRGISLGGSSRPEDCLKVADDLRCIGYRYRTLEGICNNVQHPYAGSAGEPLRNPTSGKNECPLCCETNRQEGCLGFTKDGECFSFPRLLPGLGTNCPISARSPANLATAFLDASPIYGSSSAVATKIRSFRQGKLSTQMQNGETLPLPDKDQDRCFSDSAGHPCFRFGSHGLNMLPSTAGMGILWTREHNRVAKALGSLNPHWEEQRVFQEARRIVIAEFQHIAFKEFIPLLLGKETVNRFDLGLGTQGYANSYEDGTDPRPSTQFAFGAGLFYYTLKNLTVLTTPAFSVSPLYGFGGLEGVLGEESKGVLGEASLSIPPEMSRNFLRSPGSSLKWGLPELFIQMSRDGATPSYLDARAKCQLPPVSSFKELLDRSIMNPEAVARLERVYRSVSDIELVVGGLAELPLSGGLVGPTFGCVLADQFQRVRKGDRFWYENHFAPSSFTDDQLAEIRKTSFARVLCDNAGFKRMQPAALEPLDDFENCPLECSISAIPRVDLKAFADGPKIPVAFPDFIRDRVEKIEEALRAGETRVKELEMLEKARLLLKAKGLQNVARAPFLHFLVMFPDHHSIELSRHAEILSEATKLFLDKALDLNHLSPSLTEELVFRLLPSVDVSEKLGGLPEEDCLDRPWPCFLQAPYRSISGWCNNVKFPDQGASFTPFRRLLTPAYDDGFGSPRRLSVTGAPLPSPRLISNRVHSSVKKIHPKYSRFLTQWGQYVDHDITLTPITPGRDGFPLDCSACDSEVSVSPNCFPIRIPPDDPFFPSTSRGIPQCMHFARSLQGQQTLGFRQQMNQITSYVDASNVYGSDDCKAKSLREFRQGRLATQGDGLLPADPLNGDCRSDSRAHFCFRAGDARVNEHAGLSSTHTIFVREHNRVAGELAKINPHWDDERLYQESRRINIAINQLINYREYLPKVIGWKMMEKFDMILSEQGFFNGYDSRCDATLPNSFSTAAFRFGHVMVEPSLPLMDQKARKLSEHPLTELFFNASLLYGKKGISQIFRGMCRGHSMDFDTSMHDQLRNRLFEFEGFEKSGLDLAALNIQRGRDHGLPSYLDYRRHFGLRVPTSFSDLEGIVASPNIIQALENTYASVEDIDLFTGMTAEKHMVGAIVGETTAHIIADAFQRLRICDRYWFENEGQAGSMTLGQLMEIRKMTASKVVCRNSGIDRIHPLIFSSPDAHQNIPLPCDQIPDMDFGPWKDNSAGCKQNGRDVPLGGSFRESPCVSCTCIAGGIRCYSVRVNNCPRLIHKFSLSAVSSDESCVIQCSGFIRLQSS